MSSPGNFPPFQNPQSISQPPTPEPIEDESLTLDQKNLTFLTQLGRSLANTDALLEAARKRREMAPDRYTKLGDEEDAILNDEFRQKSPDEGENSSRKRKRGLGSTSSAFRPFERREVGPSSAPEAPRETNVENQMSEKPAPASAEPSRYPASQISLLFADMGMPPQTKIKDEYNPRNSIMVQNTAATKRCWTEFEEVEERLGRCDPNNPDELIELSEKMKTAYKTGGQGLCLNNRRLFRDFLDKATSCMNVSEVSRENKNSLFHNTIHLLKMKFESTEKFVYHRTAQNDLSVCESFAQSLGIEMREWLV